MKTKTKILIAVIALIFVVGVASTSVWALSVINPQATFKVTLHHWLWVSFKMRTDSKESPK